jgi:hypothetical protein
MRTYLNTTTLTNALDASARDFAVGSTANITAGTHFLIINGEICPVQAIPVSGRVEVMRGQRGSGASAHPAGSIVYIATGADLGPLDADNWPTLTGDPGNGLPAYRLPLGSRKRTADGREFVLCDFGEALFSRQPVAISAAFVATSLGATGRGRVGVVAEATGGTSDQWGWVQIYGRCLMQIGMSTVSPSDAANGPTTLSTSVATQFKLATSLSSPAALGWVSDVTNFEGYVVDGIQVAEDASPGDVSAVTSATSHTGSQIAVFLNFPQIRFVQHAS